MNKLGLTEKRVSRMRYGSWIQLYDCYKKDYNMEHGNVYNLAGLKPAERKKASLLTLT